MKTKSTSLFMAAGLVIASVTGAVADTIKVGLADNFPPYFWEEDGKLKGLAIDMATAILDSMGHEVQIDLYPANRLVKKLADGEVTVEPYWSPTPEREEVAIFTTTPYIDESHNLIARKDAGVSFNGDIAALSDKKFLSMSGWTHGKMFDNADLNKEPVKSIDTQCKMLERKRGDFAVMSPQTFMHTCKAVGIDPGQFVALEPAVGVFPVFMAVSRNAENAEKFRQALDDATAAFIKTDGYKKIKEKYGF